METEISYTQFCDWIRNNDVALCEGIEDKTASWHIEHIGNIQRHAKEFGNKVSYLATSFGNALNRVDVFIQIKGSEKIGHYVFVARK